MRPTTMAEIAAAAPIIPVVTIERVEEAVPLAEALRTGGLRAVEITLRSDAARAALMRIREALPEFILGVGTVTRPEEFGDIARLGADFAVSPGVTPELLAAAEATGLPFLPGAATASEIMILSLRGWRYVKFFPAEVSGGRAALKALGPVFPHMQFCPTGGITAENAADYLALDNVACVGGSWITPAEAVRAGDWAEIERRAEWADRMASSRRTGTPAC